MMSKMYHAISIIVVSKQLSACVSTKLLNYELFIG